MPTTAYPPSHPVAYPLYVNGVWRSTCTRHPGHYWAPLADQQQPVRRAS